MNINFNTHETLKVLSKIKIPYLISFLAFISSFNLWFLSIYFYNNELIQKHGLWIALLVTFALTISWCLISSIIVPKYFILVFTERNTDFTDSTLAEGKSIINTYIFFEIIVLHSFFLYLEYLFN